MPLRTFHVQVGDQVFLEEGGEEIGGFFKKVSEISQATRWSAIACFLADKIWNLRNITQALNFQREPALIRQFMHQMQQR